MEPATYAVDKHGLITTPGKFEGEPLWVPFFWGLGLLGDGDDSTDDDGTPVWGFPVTDADARRFPALTGISYVELREADNGFVFADTYKSTEREDK